MVFRALDSVKSIYRPNAKIGGFIWALLLSGIAMGLYRGVQDNFLSGVVHIDEFERGITEFFRELPGLFLILILAWMYRFSENRIFKIGISFMIAALAILAVAGFLPEEFFPGIRGKVTIVFLMVLYSVGEHIIMPVRSSISLDIAKEDKGGISLGITGALGHCGNIIGFLFVTASFMVFSRYGLSKIAQFRIVYMAATILMILAFLACSVMREIMQKNERPRFFFSKKFSKFYMLEVFYGARKQVFITFAPYVIIREYKADTKLIALLLAISAVCGLIASPLIGKLIDRIGYKLVMIFDTIILVGVCFLYGYSHILFPSVAFYIVCVNYILDAIISVASMATNVYVKDIAANQDETTATLSTGISINHIISIIIALLGGFIWKNFGIEVLFSMSALLGLISSFYAATIKAPKKEKVNYA